MAEPPIQYELPPTTDDLSTAPETASQNEEEPLLSIAQQSQLMRVAVAVLMVVCYMTLLAPHVVAIIVTLNYANVECVQTHLTTEALVRWNWVAAFTSLSAYAYLGVIRACVAPRKGYRTLFIALYALTAAVLLVTGIVTLVPLHSGCMPQLHDWLGLYLLTIIQMAGPVVASIAAFWRVGCAISFDCCQCHLPGTGVQDL